MQKMIGLRECPFCEGEAELKVQDNVFGMKAARVTCKSCHCVSNCFVEGKTVAFTNIPSRFVTLEECINKAVDQWNRRFEKEAEVCR